VYIADLDAIEGRAPQAALVRSLMSATESVWLDAGVASVAEADRALEGGVERVIVGLETLPSFDVLESICKHVGSCRVVFSLDLRDGVAISSVEQLRSYTADDLAARAADAGVSAVIVLDLARVGADCGVDTNLLARIRSSARGVDVYAGGGVRDAVDLEHVRRIGCRGALVASALLDGQLAPPQTRSAS
jgi:phosphoribosylformimino-5-aminoimidazole carboxamide ribotide isomerase